MTDGEYHGPDPEMLRHLKDMLPSYAAGVLEKKIGGRNGKIIPLEQPLKPTKVCECCGKVFDLKRETDGEIKPGVCVSCQKELDKGFIAIVCSDITSDQQCCFLSKDYIPEMSGKIVQVSQRAFNIAKEKCEKQSQKKGGGEENPA